MAEKPKHKTKFVIVYLTDSNSLYEKKFTSREKVDKWIDKNELYKCKVIVIEGKSKVTVEDHT